MKRAGPLLLVVFMGCGSGPAPDEDAGGGPPGGADAGAEEDAGSGPPPPAEDAGTPPPDDGGPPIDPPPALEVEKVEGGGLRMTGAGPALFGQCDLGTCQDLDGDGLSDAWEAKALEYFRPLVRVTDDEPLLTDEAGVFAFVGRARLLSASPLIVHLYIMLGYSKDYGNCGLTAHNGDSERVVVELEAVPLGEPGDVQTRRAYTAAHEGTVTDHGRIYESGELDSVLDYTLDEDGRWRWLVRSSRSKHATYGNFELCRDAFSLPCFAETCAEDGQGVDLDGPIVNAGEPDAHLLDDLTDLGFPGDFAWEDQPFCGGVREGGCSSSVLSKLTTDPFVQ